MTDCIPCLVGEIDKDGYRRLRIEGTRIRAHRFVWMLMRGPIPSGLVVRHKCDNPPCVNIGHLELGTAKDNVQDSISRGRANRKPKLSESEVIEVIALLADGAKHASVAELYGLNIQVIKDISRCKTWKYLPR